MPKVSVVIPVYGVEQFIERCASSLFEQTLDDMEYIFIDDCSPDNSLTILKQVIERYPSRKNQVKIISLPQNKGIANARKLGYATATGDFVIMCDSDDWVDTTMYRRMYDFAIANNHDLVWCDIFRTDGSSKQILKQSSPSDKTQFIRDLLTNRNMGSVCNRLFKRSLFQSTNIMFPTVNMGEDLVISLQLTIAAKSIGHLCAPLYYYYVNPESVCRTSDETRVLKTFNEMLTNSKLIFAILEKNGLLAKYAKEIESKKCYDKDALKQLLLQKKYRRLWRNTYPEVNYKCFISPYLMLKTRFRSMLIMTGLMPIVAFIAKLRS